MNRAMKRLQLARMRKRRTASHRFRMERNSVLRSLDPDMMEAFLVRWRAPQPKAWATDKEDVRTAVLHYARLQCDDMTTAEKLFSAKWLVERTYSLPSGFALVDDKLTFTKPNRNDGPNFGMDGPDDGDK